MDSDFVVYDSPQNREIMKTEFEKFEATVYKLSEAGIKLNLVTVTMVDDLPEGSEIRNECTRGMQLLPASVYKGVIVDTCSYPTDRILVDYLDIPKGVLSVDREYLPPENEMFHSCMYERKY